jgi:MFS family permease
MAAAVFGAADIALFHPVPDPYREPKAGGGLLRAMRTPLKDRQFLAFGGFVGVLTFAVSFMGQFTTLYLFERVYIGDKAASFGTGAQTMLLVMPMVAQLFVLPVWGRAADRIGKKPILTIAALGMVPIGIAWTLLGPSNVWLGYVLSFSGAVFWTGVEVANFNLVIEMSGRGDGQGGSAYVAVNTVIVNIAGCMGGLAAGLIAQSLRDFHWAPIWGFKTFTFYDALFALSGVMRLLAVAIFLPFIHEPSARPAGEALRFISANIYSNVFNAVLQPLKVFRPGRPTETPPLAVSEPRSEAQAA